MNFQKSIAISFAVTALFVSFGCGGGGNQSGSGSSTSISAQQKKNIDEATIKSILKKTESANIADKKAVCPVEKQPGFAILKTPLIDVQAEWQNAFFNQVFHGDNLSVSEIKQDGELASARVSYVTLEKKPRTEVLYFMRMNGKWYLDPLGFKIVKSLKVAVSDERLEAAANLGYTYENQPVIFFDVRSKTATSYKIGWAGPAEFILITDAGEFSTQNIGVYTVPIRPVKVSSAEAIRVVLPFNGAMGKPQAIRVIGFNELNNGGTPAGFDERQVVTFTLSE